MASVTFQDIRVVGIFGKLADFAKDLGVRELIDKFHDCLIGCKHHKGNGQLEATCGFCQELLRNVLKDISIQPRPISLTSGSDVGKTVPLMAAISDAALTA